jgi:hypothetical protein
MSAPHFGFLLLEAEHQDTGHVGCAHHDNGSKSRRQLLVMILFFTHLNSVTIKGHLFPLIQIKGQLKKNYAP